MIGQALTLSRLRKSYGDIVAVNETDLEIDAGEFVSIVGPSGSGKTSLLTLIAGFEPPSSGAIRIGDKDITYLPPYLRDIGMVFQKYALFPHLTVRQNIAFPLKMRRRAAKSTIAARVEEMLELVQLPQHGSLSKPAVGRPAAACRGRPRARFRSSCHLDGRTAWGARQEAT